MLIHDLKYKYRLQPDKVALLNSIYKAMYDPPPLTSSSFILMVSISLAHILN